ncbi:uncharacterized protein LOC123299961 [Chrysoperla carnea]|uniref:uncharacterized protein LOC123299961 n=1 Tax=Chrysoperla carnea TaxID=189513 RepID=UPI001D06F6B9|nr:uncharacterized protein LOC123299961 [Chrysoperla carnea]
MESYLMDIQRVRIPRPKFTSENGRRPHEPPKDYHLDDHVNAANKINTRVGGVSSRNDFIKTAETLQRLTIHDNI